MAQQNPEFVRLAAELNELYSQLKPVLANMDRTFLAVAKQVGPDRWPGSDLAREHDRFSIHSLELRNVLTGTIAKLKT